MFAAPGIRGLLWLSLAPAGRHGGRPPPSADGRAASPSSAPPARSGGARWPWSAERARALPGRGGDRARRTSTRSPRSRRLRRPARGDRRSGLLPACSRSTSPAAASRSPPVRTALTEAAAAAGRMGHGRRSSVRPGCGPTLAAVRRGAMVALANKECLVCAGALFMREVEPPWAPCCCRSIPSTTRSGRRLRGERRRVRRAADPDRFGRAVPGWSSAEMAGVTPSRRCPPELVDGRQDQRRQRHHDEQGPRDDRGPPSVRPCPRRRSRCWSTRSRSCTAWSPSRDGSVLAQLGEPDMRIPIAYTLGLAGAARHRRAANSTCAPVAAWSSSRRTWSGFPALRLAGLALRQGGAATYSIECRQRGGGRGVPGGADRLSRHRPYRGTRARPGAGACRCDDLDEHSRLRCRGAARDGRALPLGGPDAPDRMKELSAPCSRPSPST